MSSPNSLERTLIEMMKFNRHARQLNEFNRALALSRAGSTKQTREPTQMAPEEPSTEHSSPPQPEIEAEIA